MQTEQTAVPETLTAFNSVIHVMSKGRPQDINLLWGDGLESSSSHVIECYAIVPSFENPRVLLPLDSANAALGTALGQHATGAASPFVRAAARGLQLANYVGLARPLLRYRLAIAMLDPGRSETELHALLREVLGRGDFVTSVRIAPRRPNGKPVVQAISGDGTVLAYAKFGCGTLTERLVQHEAEVLQELEGLTQGSLLRVPRVLFSGPWHGTQVIVMAPLHGHPIRFGSAEDMPIDACIALAALRPRARLSLGDSAFWRRMVAQIADVAPVLGERAQGIVLAAREVLSDRWANACLPVGQCHGDWIPANISETMDGSYNIWDWELGDSDAPLGIDAMHFILQWELRSRRSAPAIGDRILRLGRDALHQQGLDPRTAPLLVSLNLLRMIILYGEARQSAPEAAEGDGRYIRLLQCVVGRL